MTDIVERQRSGDASWELREKAVDEIERLRARLDISLQAEQGAVARIAKLEKAADFLLENNCDEAWQELAEAVQEGE